LDMSYSSASSAVRSQRPSAQPNPGFVNQLIAFEDDGSEALRSKLWSEDQRERQDKDREFLEKQEGDALEASAEIVKTISPILAQRLRAVLQSSTSLFRPIKEETKAGRIRSYTSMPNASPVISPKSPTQQEKLRVVIPPLPQEKKSEAEVGVLSMMDWGLRLSGGGEGFSRARAATTLMIDKQGKKDLWLPDNFTLPTPPPPPAALVVPAAIPSLPPLPLGARPSAGSRSMVRRSSR